MIGAALIVAGYATVVFAFGWLGLAVVALHIAVLLLALKR